MNYKWYVKDEILIIQTPGDMPDWERGGAPWYFEHERITMIYLMTGVSSIGDYAFWGFDKLKLIQFSANLKRIGVSAFADCVNLTRIAIPDSVLEIGSNAFSGCKQLVEVFLPTNLECLSSGIFHDCLKLEKVTIPNKIAEIDIGAFYGCSTIRHIQIPRSVKQISGAFMLCRNITQMILPDSIVEMNGTFLGCTKLSHFVVPEKVEQIGKYTFAYCKNLSTITIHKGVQIIDTAAFYNCGRLTTVFYQGLENDWKQIKISDGNEALEGAVVKCGISPSETGSYIVEYYCDVDHNNPSPVTTFGVTGVPTMTATIENLGFSKEGYLFEGWRVYRSEDQKWFLRSKDGKNQWMKLTKEGRLPDDFQYVLMHNARTLKSPAKKGTVKFFAQWGGKEFDVVYHKNETASEEEGRTKVTYGVPTPIMFLKTLQFTNEEKTFQGWKMCREIDGKWWMKNKEGKSSWRALKNGKPDAGFRFVLLKDGQNLTKAATSGKVHLYAQWKS